MLTTLLFALEILILIVLSLFKINNSSVAVAHVFRLSFVAGLKRDV